MELCDRFHNNEEDRQRQGNGAEADRHPWGTLDTLGLQISPRCPGEAPADGTEYEDQKGRGSVRPAM
jgi:hypothetical protein